MYLRFYNFIWTILLLGLSLGFTASAWEIDQKGNYDFSNEKVVVMPFFQTEPNSFRNEGNAEAAARLLAESLRKNGIVNAVALTPPPAAYWYCSPYSALALAQRTDAANAIVTGTLQRLPNAMEWQAMSLYLCYLDPQTNTYNVVSLLGSYESGSLEELMAFMGKQGANYMRKISPQRFFGAQEHCPEGNIHATKLLPDPTWEPSTSPGQFPREPQALYEFMKENGYSLAFSPEGNQLLDEIIAFVETSRDQDGKNLILDSINRDVSFQIAAVIPRDQLLHASTYRDEVCYVWLIDKATKTRHQLAAFDFSSRRLTTLLTTTIAETQTEEDAAFRAGQFDVEYPYAVGILNRQAIVFNLEEKNSVVLNDLPYSPDGGTLLNGRIFLLLDDHPEKKNHAGEHLALLSCDLTGKDRRILYDSGSEENNRPLEKLSQSSFAWYLKNARLLGNPNLNNVVIFSSQCLLTMDPEGGLITCNNIATQKGNASSLQSSHCFFSAGSNGYAKYDLQSGLIDGYFYCSDFIKRDLNIPEQSHLCFFEYVLNTSNQHMVPFVPKNAVQNNAGEIFLYGEKSFFFNPSTPDDMVPFLLPDTVYKNGTPHGVYIDDDGKSFWIFSSAGYIARAELPQKK